jgi:general stress protein 26
MNKNESDSKKLWDLIKHIEVAMLTTQEADGSLHSRPMATQPGDFDGYLWFFTEASAHKVDEVHHHRQVNICYVDSPKGRYVSVSGRAQVLRDPAKVHEFWRPFLRAWFPKGPDSEEVALLRVKVDKAEYWESPSSKVVGMVGFGVEKDAGAMGGRTLSIAR